MASISTNVVQGKFMGGTKNKMVEREMQFFRATFGPVSEDGGMDIVVVVALA